MAAAVQGQDSAASLKVVQIFTEALAVDAVTAAGAQAFADALRPVIAAAMEVQASDLLLEGGSVVFRPAPQGGSPAVEVTWGINTGSVANAQLLQGRVGSVPDAVAPQTGYPPSSLRYVACHFISFHRQRFAPYPNGRRR